MRDGERFAQGFHGFTDITNLFGTLTASIVEQIDSQGRIVSKSFAALGGATADAIMADTAKRLADAKAFSAALAAAAKQGLAKDLLQQAAAQGPAANRIEGGETRHALLHDRLFVR